MLLRKALRRAGSDLQLMGLRGKAALLYEVNRLTAVLPSVPFEAEIISTLAPM